MRKLVWVLAACGGGGDEDADALADQASDDLAELATQIEAVALAASQSTARTAAPACTPAPAGTCSWCASVDGGPLSGTFDLAVAETPCGASVTRGTRSAAYEVASSALTGTYDGTLTGDYTFDATGSREATLELDPARGDAVSFDASFTLDALTATTVSLELATLEVAMTYTGFGGHTWVVEASGDTTSVTGTITADNGSSCTVSGTWDAPSVSCDP